MKLIIQIPCYNEEENIEKTITNLPRKINGIDKIEYLIINDGSTDKTEEIIKRLNVEYILNIYPNKGLANAFMQGIQNCLKNGADIIVNIDGDNQYDAKYIEQLVTPIIKKEADIVIGERQIEKFSFLKRVFQKIGSLFVRIASGTKVPDAPSGFRAFSREYAMKLNVYNEFTYTLETLIQAGKNKAKIKTVKVESNPYTRKSRLFKSSGEYIRKSFLNIIKACVIYRSALVFFLIGLVFIFSGIIIVYFSKLIGTLMIFTGINAELIALKSNQDIANRKLLEDIQYRLRKMEYDSK